MSLSVYQDLGYLAASLGQAAVTRPTIKLGSKGPAVAEAQQLLAAKYGLELNVTNPGNISLEEGVFDAGTDEIAKRFQYDNGLKVDGIIGPNTWGKLLNAKVTSPGTSTGGGGTSPGTSTGKTPSMDELMAKTASPDKIFGLPKMVVYAGGAVVLLGAFFLLSSPSRQQA